MKQNWYKRAQSKILYMMRGLPGSGKSSIAKDLGLGGAIFSTDDFFIINGKYQYDPSMIGHAHTWNQGRAKKAMRDGISPIVIDNTNIEGWQMKPYVGEAIAHGYRVEIVEPNTAWKFDAEELAKRNTHKVPLDIIQEMVEKWEPNLNTEDILESKEPPKPEALLSSK